LIIYVVKKIEDSWYVHRKYHPLLIHPTIGTGFELRSIGNAIPYFLPFKIRFV